MDFEVLIVGAGPVGLILAHELAVQKVTCLVVDRVPAPAEYSRALVVHSRTQDLLERAGLRKAFLSASIELRGMQMWRGGREVGRIPFDLANHPALSLPQQETESILRAAVSRQGVEVRWGAELTALAEDGEGVTATIAGASLRVAYVVGCDGAHSAVRRLMGAQFEGDTLPETVWMADARIDWEVTPAFARQFLHDEGALSAIPMPGGWWRLAAAADGPGQPGAAFFERLIRRRAGYPQAQVEVGWTSSFTVNCRLASTYRRGRLLLAGDAAHIHSPMGGQGMNIGMQDSFLVSEKLATVCRGADAVLLDTYEAERRPVAAAVIASNQRITKLAMNRSPIGKLLRNRVLPLLLNIPAVSRRMGLEAASGGIRA